MAVALLVATVAWACGPLLFDKAAYAPGEQVTVSGNIPAPNEEIRIKLESGTLLATVRTSESGDFETSFTLAADTASGTYNAVVEEYLSRGSFEVRSPGDVDREAPSTAITSGPSGTVTSTSASFGFNSSESGSSFRCVLDGVENPCSSPQAYSGLGQGPHTFEVYAIDRAANRDSTPATRTWEVDTIRPAVKTVSPASNATGVSPGANVLATFSEAMDASTLTTTSVKLIRRGTTKPVAATVTYDAVRRRVTLNSKSALLRGATYAATVTTGAKDSAGNPLVRSKTWSFSVRR